MAERQTNPNVQAVSNKLVQDYLISNFGEESVKIIRAATEEMTDDALAVKCKLKVSEIRALLNKMHSIRLAEYTRIKDKDTGWYSYIWRINLRGIYDVLDLSMQNEMNQLNNRLEENTTVLSYICSKCSKTNVIDFELASKLAFRCPNCKRRLYEKKNNNEESETRLRELTAKHSVLQGFIQKQEEIRKIEEMKRLEAVAIAKAEALRAAEEAAEAVKKAKAERRIAMAKARSVARSVAKAALKSKSVKSSKSKRATSSAKKKKK